jgi:hypothetical protein
MPADCCSDFRVPSAQLPLGKVDKKTVGKPPPAAEANRLGQTLMVSVLRFPSWLPWLLTSPQTRLVETGSEWNQTVTRLLSEGSWRWTGPFQN